MNVFQFIIIYKRTNNANNATHYVKLGEKRRKSSKRNYYIISPSVIIKAIIIKCASACVCTSVSVRVHVRVGFDFPLNKASGAKLVGSRHWTAAFFLQVPDKCTDPDLTLLNILI